MDKELMLDVGQANELKLAFRRSGWNNEDIKKLCEGDILARVWSVLVRKARIVQNPPLFPVWEMIIVGRTDSYDKSHFGRSVFLSGFKICGGAHDIFDELSMEAEARELGLVILSQWELGFRRPDDMPFYEEVSERALDLGYLPCPPEVGFQLCHQSRKLPEDRILVSSDRPLKDSEGNTCLIMLEKNEKERRICAYKIVTCAGARYCPPDNLRMVFVRPR